MFSSGQGRIGTAETLCNARALPSRLSILQMLCTKLLTGREPSHLLHPWQVFAFFGSDPRVSWSTLGYLVVAGSARGGVDSLLVRIFVFQPLGGGQEIPQAASCSLVYPPAAVFACSSSSLVTIV